MSKSIALAAAAATLAIGSSFAGTSSAEAGYHSHRSHGYSHYRVYKPHYVVKRVYKPVVVYKPVTVYKPVHVYKPAYTHHYGYGYKTW